jgi:hypothetical protein
MVKVAGTAAADGSADGVAGAAGGGGTVLVTSDVGGGAVTVTVSTGWAAGVPVVHPPRTEAAAAIARATVEEMRFTGGL